jgi:hypothetical protein
MYIDASNLDRFSQDRIFGVLRRTRGETGVDTLIPFSDQPFRIGKLSREWKFLAVITYQAALLPPDLPWARFDFPAVDELRCPDADLFFIVMTLAPDLRAVCFVPRLAVLLFVVFVERWPVDLPLVFARPTALERLAVVVCLRPVVVPGLRLLPIFCNAVSAVSLLTTLLKLLRSPDAV